MPACPTSLHIRVPSNGMVYLEPPTPPDQIVSTSGWGVSTVPCAQRTCVPPVMLCPAFAVGLLWVEGPPTKMLPGLGPAVEWLVLTSLSRKIYSCASHPFPPPPSSHDPIYLYLQITNTTHTPWLDTCNSRGGRTVPCERYSQQLIGKQARAHVDVDRS